MKSRFLSAIAVGLVAATLLLAGTAGYIIPGCKIAITVAGN